MEDPHKNCTRQIEELKKNLMLKNKLIEEFRVLLSSRDSDQNNTKTDVRTIYNTVKRVMSEHSELVKTNGSLFEKTKLMKRDINRYGLVIRGFQGDEKKWKMEKESLKNQIEKLNEELSERSESSEHNYQELTKRYEQQSIVRQQVIDNQKKEIRMKDAQLREMSNLLEKLKSETSGHGDLLKKLKERNATLTKDNQMLSSSMDYHQKSSDNRIKDITAKNIGETERLTKELEERNKLLVKQKEIYEEERRKNQQISDDYRIMKSENEKLNQSNNEQLNKYTEEMKSYKQKIAQLEQEVRNKESLKEQVRKNHEKDATGYIKKIEEMKEYVKELEERMKELENDRDSLLEGEFLKQK